MPPPILATTRRIVDVCSRRVRIPAAGVERASQFYLQAMAASGKDVNAGKEMNDVSDWSAANPLHPQQADAAAVDWIFLMDLLNFSFWSDDSKDGGDKASEYAVTYGGRRWTGYWTLCACLRRALDSGIPITTPAYYATVDLETVRHLFRGDDNTTEMPMLQERLACMNQAGQTLCQTQFGGTFQTLLREASGSAGRLLDLVLQHFPVFRDDSVYPGVGTVHFCKRAQILVADLWACFQGRGLGAFHDIDQITMFADYRVPQSLVACGALEYSDELMAELRSGVLMESGDPRECEIRACSIWAVELIRQRLEQLGTRVNAIQLDFFLWDYAKAHPDELAHIPVHRTRSIRY